MARHNDTGKKGEVLACAFLKKKGYEILETNWRWSRAEVDIIARLDEQIIFVEVKTRTKPDFGNPEEFVSTQKETLLARAASVYLEKTAHEGELRFDIISIILKEKAPEIHHFRDAFFPGLK